MSKAEEKALEAYPKSDDAWGDEWQKRVGFVKGYNQATDEILEAIKNHLLNHGYMELWEFEAMLSFTKIK